MLPNFLIRAMRGRTLRPLALGSATLLLSFALGGQAVAATITGSKHDLTAATGGAATKFTPTAGDSEICVFCHTPHGSDTSASVPLWNRKLAVTAYTTYNTLGTSSMVGGTAKVGSVSVACLSCHDGLTAMNTAIMNAPGSGNYNAAGGTWAGTWSAGGTIPAGGITNIGTDLKNDHPVGVQYAGGPLAATLPAAGTDYTTGLFRNADFNTAKSANVNGKVVWWVDSGTAAGTRDKADMQLYTRNPTTDLGNGTNGTSVIADFGLAQNVDQPFVECASCHDPHGGVTGTTFLRKSNAGSAVCLACHVK